MSRLLICSEPDLPSVNMRAALMGMHRWEDLGESGGARFCVCGDTYMMSIDDMHIRHDDLDRQAEDFGIAVDDDILDGLKFRKRQVEYRIKHCTCNLLHLFFGQHGIVFFLNDGDKRFHSPSPVA